jgi:CHAT domain-containing protein/tetratricopeptide (TPR) repeat protein
MRSDINLLKQVLRFVALCILISSGIGFPALTFGSVQPLNSLLSDKTASPVQTELTGKNLKEIVQLNDYLKDYLSHGDLVNAGVIEEKILSIINSTDVDDNLLSESYYYIGIYKLKSDVYYESVRYLNLCIAIKEKRKEVDERYAKALYNLSLAYNNLGDFIKCENYALKALETGKSVYEESNPNLLICYLSVVGSLVETKKYEDAINYANIALAIKNKNPDLSSMSVTASLYHDLGVCYSKLGDISKAKIYLDKTELIFEDFDLPQNDNYINILNGLAVIYTEVGQTEKASTFYEKGVALGISRNSLLSFNIINSYSIFLAKIKNTDKGRRLLQDAVSRAKSNIDLNPRNYFQVLGYLANYLRNNKIDLKQAIRYYEECITYLKRNEQDESLKSFIYLGYARAQEDAGDYEKALELAQSLLFASEKKINTSDNYENPPIETLEPDIATLRILQLKYSILSKINSKNKDKRTLLAASNTSELIVSLLDKVRLNISEDESRLILGDNYRNSYLNAIHDSYLLYNETSDPAFLEKAFSYSEKSKVAGLLASTRELKAVQFHIPSSIANYEMDLQRKISLFNSSISEELAGTEPRETLISAWKQSLIEAIRTRDSLIVIFEKQYPDYYALKYNTKMVGLNDIPEIVGHAGNYINYVVSDSILYTFIVNRKNKKLLAQSIDSSFFEDIKKFRKLLTKPSPTEDALREYKEFQIIGYRLYRKLIDPVRSFLISDKLIISPDNILSYLPFETIISSVGSKEGLNYRDLGYLMNSYDISYTYSATYMSESLKKEYMRSNKLIAFAPNYPEPIDIEKVLLSRQAKSGVLSDLPYARKEAEFVSAITGGKLYENSKAIESVFKKESGKFDIIHLAMHTLLNDKDPMHSTLIFSHMNDSTEDGYLKTYEIYGIPLKAKMVVLSSCNTGTGLLFSGEGILSLARGFAYSGSQSVVMSMWEIEDKSGTDIVEMFYKNLKNGYSKSSALRKARLDFLKNADLLRSHPYFWSTLVIYGDNAPLYYSARLIKAAIWVLVIVSIGLMFYYLRRKYS